MRAFLRLLVLSAVEHAGPPVLKVLESLGAYLDLSEPPAAPAHALNSRSYSASLANLLRAGCHGTEGLVFGVTDTRRRWASPATSPTCSTPMREVLDAAGCQWAGSHTFRRTHATLADDAGASLGQIAAVLGQEPVTTSTYIKTRPIAAAVDVLRTAQLGTMWGFTLDTEPAPTCVCRSGPVLCSPGWTRTNNPPVNSRMLCQLSYRGSLVQRGETLASPDFGGEIRAGRRRAA